MNEDSYLDSYWEDQYDDGGFDDEAYYDDDLDFEPDLDEGFEFDSAMASAGWGTDEDYGYFGCDEA